MALEDLSPEETALIALDNLSQAFHHIADSLEGPLLDEERQARLAKAARQGADLIGTLVELQQAEQGHTAPDEIPEGWQHP